MKRYLPLLVFCTASHASLPPPSVLDAVRGVTRGYIAQTKHSLVDELQIVCGPYELSEEQTQLIAKIFLSEDSYEQSGMKMFCIPFYDFKMVMIDPNGGHVVTVRLCTSCGDVIFEVDMLNKSGAGLCRDGTAKLAKLFDAWFPGWREVSRSNRSQQLVPKKMPNKAPEPTPGPVTPHAPSSTSK